MRALKSIKITNFQSHKSTLINFAGPRCLTVITGPSDSGKSAVIRALRWVFYNVPQGDGFITVGESRCSVIVTYDDGTTVERVRSRGGINRYVVNGEILEGFGVGVPLEVQQATGIRTLQIGDQSFMLNLSEQLDGPFLGKSVPGSARAKVLGKLAGTEEIDFAGKEVGTDLYRGHRQQEGLETNLQKLSEQIDKYGFIPGWEMAANQVETVLSNTKNIIIKAEKLNLLMQEFQALILQVLVIEQVVDDLKDVDKGLVLVSNLHEQVGKVKELTKLKDQRIEAFRSFQRLKVVVRDLKEVIDSVNLLSIALGHECALAEKYNKIYLQLEQTASSVDSLNRVIERLVNVSKAINHFYHASTDHIEYAKLDYLFDQYENSFLSVLSFERLVKMLDKAEQSSDYLLRTFSDNSKYSKVSALWDQCKVTNTAIKFLSEKMKDFQNIEQSEEKIKQAMCSNPQSQRLSELNQQKNFILQEVNRLHYEVSAAKEAVESTEMDYLDFMGSLGKCPVCGGLIDNKKLLEVI